MPLPYPNINNPLSSALNSNIPITMMYQQEEEKIELDLNNPIFVAYVDTKNLTRQAAEEHLYRSKKMFDIYKNITIWVIASNETKIECVYDGQFRNRDMEISDLIKEINTRIDIMANSHSFDDFKINIRDWRLSELINGTEEK
jgi:antirestriction protein